MQEEIKEFEICSREAMHAFIEEGRVSKFQNQVVEQVCVLTDFDKEKIAIEVLRGQLKAIKPLKK